MYRVWFCLGIIHSCNLSLTDVLLQILNILLLKLFFLRISHVLVLGWCRLNSGLEWFGGCCDILVLFLHRACLFYLFLVRLIQLSCRKFVLSLPRLNIHHLSGLLFIHCWCYRCLVCNWYVLRDWRLLWKLLYICLILLISAKGWIVWSRLVLLLCISVVVCCSTGFLLLLV